jgi:hypothetical protein
MPSDRVEAPAYEPPTIDERAAIGHPLVLASQSSPPT